MAPVSKADLNGMGDDDQQDSANVDNTCPECGMDSVATYLDRYSSYEYCTNCDWSDEGSEETVSREPISRRDHGRMVD